MAQRTISSLTMKSEKMKWTDLKLMRSKRNSKCSSSRRLKKKLTSTSTLMMSLICLRSGYQ